MKIVETKPLTDDQLSKRDWQNLYEIDIIKDDGAAVSMHFSDGEPEDACISRDFNDVLKIKEAIIMAYEAGKNSEELITEKVDYED